MVDFLQRAQDLPLLGIGVSTEYGAHQGQSALNLLALRKSHPHFASFLEVGIETSKGLDGDAVAWLEKGLPTTYHFLDINLDESEDADERWLGQVKALQDTLQPAWMCGDAGLWHFGKRERGHMLLLPPILSEESARAMAEGVIHLRDNLQVEVLPENPPGCAFIGDLHLLEFFAQVVDKADTGMLLDCAHLAIYQRMMGHQPLDGLDGFPLERIIELHVAGTTRKSVDGFSFLEDDHTVEVLPETWTIMEYVASRATHLKAVVFECERNPIEDCLPGFSRIAKILEGSPMGQALHDSGRPL
jgi:uncharacterized protein (UPF0276 family)